MGYQWKLNGTNLSGANAATLTYSNVQTMQAGNYSVTVSNGLGSTNSATATLTVTGGTAPVITSQPASQNVVPGATVQFGVTATGSTPMSFQWAFDGTNLSGATAATLVLTNVQAGQAGYYAVTVSNGLGSTNSVNATLTVDGTLAAYFFDDFDGPALNPIWQASLPQNAHSGSFPFGYSQTATYLGAPNYGFETAGSNSVLRLTNSMDTLHRVGWCTTTNFGGTNFTYDVRFNSLTQSATTSIDGFLEIWIIDAANQNHYDIVSPFGGSYDGALAFFAGSSIDGSYMETAFTYTNNTWYHLVLQSTPGQNIRASIYDDNGTELIGTTLNHDASAFSSGFKLGLSQLIGFAQGVYPVDVAVDYAQFTSSSGSFTPQATIQPKDPKVSLSLKGSGQSMTIAWPVTMTGYVLETCTDLGTGTWVPVTNTPAQSGNEFSVPISTTDSKRFYRLNSAGTGN